jgi:hypothetical protein
VKKQLTITIDTDLSLMVDELAKKIDRNKSDTINGLLWVTMQRMSKSPPKNYGELISQSAGSAAVIDAQTLSEIFVKNPTLLGEVEKLLKRHVEEAEKK